MTEKVERRLAAILSADVVGYSGMMEADEKGTLSRLQALRRDFVDPKIAEHNGRIVKLMGDGALVDFASVVDAVECAVEIQRGMRERNANTPEKQCIAFRIGVNLGDIIVEGDDIYGSGVNVAARLEQLADAGGIVVSGTAYDQARNIPEIGYEDLGPQKVKNITDPVRAYRVLLAADAAGKLVESRAAKRHRRRLGPTMAVAAGIAVIGLAAGILLSLEPWVPRVEAADEANMAYALPDKPSIAIMPFENLSGDPEQDYLANGIVETIITTLSQTDRLFVIARNSTSAYVGKQVTPKEVAETFGVGNILEGSFQKSGKQVRITARLIDALSGRQLWAGRYDRPMDDIFAMQDDITYNIVEELQVELTVGEKGRLWRKGWHSAEAYQIGLRALWHFLRPTATDLERAVALSEEAIALDPEAAGAYASLGWNLHSQYLNGWAADPAETYKRAVAAAQKAIALDDTLATGHELMAWIHTFDGNHDAAIAAADTGAKLVPGSAGSASLYSAVLVQAGRAQEAVEWFNRAKRLDPKIIPQWHWSLSEAYRQLGRFEEMIEVSKYILASNETFWFEYPRLVYAYFEMGDMDEAKKWLDKMLDGHPERVHVWPFIVASTAPEPREKFISTLVKAGFPMPESQGNE